MYVIKGVDWHSRCTDTFVRRKDNNRISFFDFYRNMYNMVINDVNQPLLDCVQVVRKPGAGKPERVVQPVKLVPEFCAISGESLLSPHRFDIMFSKEYNSMTNLNPTLR